MTEKYSDETLPPSNNICCRWLRFDEFAPEQAFTSHTISTKALLCIRLIFAIYTDIVLWIWITQLKGLAFQYFTTLTFLALHAYQVTALVHHICYLYNGRKIKLFLNQPILLSYAFVCLYITVITFNILTPVVHWSMLARYQTIDNPMDRWTNVSVHGVSFAMMIIDVTFTRIKVYFNMVVLPLFVMLLYMFLTFLIYAINGYWVYPVLSWSQGPIAAVWYLLMTAVCIIGFFLQVLIHRFRDHLGGRWKMDIEEEEKQRESIHSAKLTPGVYHD